jgi:hypothetical protein
MISSQNVVLHAGEVVAFGRESGSVAERIRHLQREARSLADDQVKALGVDLKALAIRAVEIADGGDAFPPGVRELAARLATDLTARASALTALQHRNSAYL